GNGGLGRGALLPDAAFKAAVDVELLLLRLQPAADRALDAGRADAELGVEVEVDVTGGPDGQCAAADLRVEHAHVAAQLPLPRQVAVGVRVQDRAVDGQRGLAALGQGAHAHVPAQLERWRSDAYPNSDPGQ